MSKTTNTLILGGAAILAGLAIYSWVRPKDKTGTTETTSGSMDILTDINKTADNVAEAVADTMRITGDIAQTAHGITTVIGVPFDYASNMAGATVRLVEGSSVAYSAWDDLTESVLYFSGGLIRI